MKLTLQSTIAHTLPGLLATTLLTVLLIPSTDANINMTLSLERYNGEFKGGLYMYANGASAPITHHRVESPNNIIYMNTDFSEQSNTNLSYAAMLNECTNGLWTLTLNEGDVSQEQYAFSVSFAGFTSNMFGDTIITNPLNSAVVSTNQPLIEWTSTSLFPEVHIQVHNGLQPPVAGNWTNMVAPVNSFIPEPILAGVNYALVYYLTNDFAGITITVPTNLVEGATVADWTARGDLRSRASSSFEAPGGGGDPFDVAVESPGLTWNTYGNSAGWFVSASDFSEGPTALQSGFVFDSDSSRLEATVTGPGTVSFDWALFADYGDYFEFESYDDSSGEDSDYFYYEGYEAYGWDSYSLTLHSNDTYTLSWTFYNDDDSGFDLDAAFIDNVVAPGGGGSPDYEAGISGLFFCTHFSRHWKASALGC